MDKLKKWLVHNTSLKIISVITAFIIWLLVANTSNPVRTESITVPVTILNENTVTGSNKIFYTDKSSVTISYRIRSKDTQNIKTGEFSAYADFKKLGQDGKVPVEVSISETALGFIDDVTVLPQEIHVMTENIQQKKFAVNHVTFGDVAEGYVEGEVNVSPEYIYVKGPVSVIGQISTTGIVIDVSEAREEINGTAEIVFYDANGNILPDIGESLSYAGGISYTLPVYRTKSLSVNAFTGGSPASGYYVEGMETSPTFITVYGPEEELDKHSYVLISGSYLNINGASSGKTFTVDAEDFLPEGLSLVHPNSEIVIYVKIREIPEAETASEMKKPASGSDEPKDNGQSDVTEQVHESTEAVSESASENESSASEENSEETGYEETDAQDESATGYEETDPAEEETEETADFSDAPESEAENSHGDDI